MTYALPDGAPTPAQVETLITRPGPLADGERLYHSWCARCHGAGAVSASALPDLRDSLRRLGPAFDEVALNGLAGTAMPAMAPEVSREDVALIRAYLEARAER